MNVSHQLFEKISDDCRPQLLEVHSRGGTSGEPLTSYGKAIMEIRMGPLCFNHICVVADIIDEVLLGKDLLLCDSSGHADIIQCKENDFRGATIPLKMVRPPVVRCVTLAKSVEVPPIEEAIV